MLLKRHLIQKVLTGQKLGNKRIYDGGNIEMKNFKILKNCIISGFADEIDKSVDNQIALLKELKISHVEFRSGDGKGIAEKTARSL